jgi:enterochelin esterase family protein
LTRISEEHLGISPVIVGDNVTFVWQGAEKIQLLGDFNNWGRNKSLIDFQQEAPNLWKCRLKIPTDSYVEYAYLKGQERFPDPLNPFRAEDGIGHINSYFWMPNANDTPLARPAPNVAQGVVSTQTVVTEGLVSGSDRPLYLYQPPVSQPVPLVVVLDGSDYLEKARLTVIVDNLIAQGRIQPIALAMVAPAKFERRAEYACSDTTVAFVLDRILPVARDHLNLLDVAQYPGTYCMMGASMGGLMSFYTALRAPEIFGKVLCESGAFGAHQPDYRLYNRSVIEDLIRYCPPPPLKLWLDCGIYEWFIEPNRQMQALLQERGFDHSYLETNSGHNYPSWRNVLWKGLEWLFPPK